VAKIQYDFGSVAKSNKGKWYKMSGGNIRRFILLEVEVHDPELSNEESELFTTKLTHASLAGALILAHGVDREMLLRAVSVDEKEIDPVRVLFEQVRELSGK
jgi:hypothetical protein